LNGQSSVHIDRGQWLYRFVLDTECIAIYRSSRAGQEIAPPEIWRAVAVLGVTDVFVFPTAGGWQAFIELAEGRQRWALERRASLGEAEDAARHLLATLADAVAHAVQSHGPLGEALPSDHATRVPPPPLAPAEDAEVEALLAEAVQVRAAAGWELIYSRQRATR
jgi:hypothetical protein